MSVPAHISLRQRAIDDADTAFDYLRAQAPPGTAENFVDDLERAFRLLARHPLTGSMRFAFELDIPNLRTWPLARFPYLIFYVVSDDQIDVWRILHASRDVPASLADEQPDPLQQ
ncbi:MAG: type II toxin-antitoxin system RelE/ParE family toxin [Acidimicrobiales bacterium]